MNLNATDEKQLEAVLTCVSNLFDHGALAVYQYGSALLGGLRRSSDLDLFVLLDRKTSLDERRSLVEQMMQVSGKRGTRISGRPIELTIALRDDIQPWRPNPRRASLPSERVGGSFVEKVVVGRTPEFLGSLDRGQAEAPLLRCPSARK